jgi:hypothetical protein
MSCGSKEQANNLTVRQKILVCGLGPIIGFIPVLVFGILSYQWLFFTVLLCLGDIIVLNALSTFKGATKDLKIKDFTFLTVWKGVIIKVDKE